MVSEFQAPGNSGGLLGLGSLELKEAAGGELGVYRASIRLL